MNKHIIVELDGRDRIELIHNSGREEIKAIVCSECLDLLRDLKNSQKPVKDWILPTGNSHSAILIREFIMKVRGDWKFPCEQNELCHCRAVSMRQVDQAVVAGAHSITQIREATSASTGCGTCWPEIEKIIRYRLASL